jgi:hypothetical protein
MNARWGFGHTGSQLVSKQGRPVQMQYFEGKMEERDRQEQVLTWNKNVQ